jgi:flagellar hook-associated protein 1 FlgK
MSLLSGALQIGRTALLSYQSAMQVVGNNISNVGSEEYTRQTPILTAVPGTLMPQGFMPGGGVTLSGLRRNVDETLENRIRVALGDQSDATIQEQTIGRIESIMNELSDSDLSTLLQDFFNAFNALQNQPHDLAYRSTVVTNAKLVSTEIHRQREDLLALAEELNRSIESTVVQVNEITAEIGKLNVRIAELESTGQGMASSLRDQRDAHLRELGELIEIEVREQPNGGIIVYAGTEPIVQNGDVRELITTSEVIDDYPKVIIRYADTNREVQLRGGELAGLQRAREDHIIGQIETLNGLSQVLINEVNKIHARGQGASSFEQVLGEYDVKDPNAALNDSQSGLILTPQNGSFLFTVTDTRSGASKTFTIPVDLDGVGTDDSLASLAAQMNGKTANVTVEASGDNRLKLTAAEGFEFSFSEDTSNVLAALGVNTFFTGKNSQSIDVNPTVESDPFLIAAGKTDKPGDGSNASEIAKLATNRIDDLGNRSISDYYNAIVTDVAVKGSAARAGVEAADAISLSLVSQRESISGVNLDEETISLLRFERAFQGAARYTNSVDQLLQEMLGLIR